MADAEVWCVRVGKREERQWRLRRSMQTLRLHDGVLLLTNGLGAAGGQYSLCHATSIERTRIRGRTSSKLQLCGRSLNALLAFQSAEECTAARAHILQASERPNARPLTVGAQTASLPDLKDPSVQLFALQLLLDPRFARFVKQSGEFYDSVNTAISGDVPAASRPGPSQSPSTEPAR